MTPPTRQHHDNPNEPYDDASQPEVLYDKKNPKPEQQKPSQAEGDRETVEEDLEDKFNSRS